jgi:hypothetical protein
MISSMKRSMTFVVLALSITSLSADYSSFMHSWKQAQDSTAGRYAFFLAGGGLVLVGLYHSFEPCKAAYDASVQFKNWVDDKTKDWEKTRLALRFTLPLTAIFVGGLLVKKSLKN